MNALPLLLAASLLTSAAALPHSAVAQPSAMAVAADLKMMQDAAPFRRAADTFVERARRGDAAGTMAMLSRALVERSGEPAIHRALDAQILPFFAQGGGVGRSVTTTRTTDAAGQQGFAFYMWWQPTATAGAARPFTVYVVEEQGRAVVANIVPDRKVEGRHQ